MAANKPNLQTYVNSWRQMFPGWTVVVWDEPAIQRLFESAADRLPPDTAEAYHRLKRMAMKSDLARYAIVYLLGGMYVDTDLECLRPFDVWLPKDKPTIMHLTEMSALENKLFYGGFTSNNNWFYAPQPGWPSLFNILSEAVPKVMRASQQTLSHAPFGFVLKVTGPTAFSKAISAEGPDRIHHMPASLLDPTLTRMHLHNLDNDDARKAMPYAYAIHHSEASWIMSNKGVLNAIMAFYGGLRENSLVLAVCLIIVLALFIVAVIIIIIQRKAVCKPVCAKL